MSTLSALFSSIFILVSCTADNPARRVHRSFTEKYPTLLDYTEWEALTLLKNVTLKEICVKHSGINRRGTRGEAEIRRQIRRHINYYDNEEKTRIVRIDLLQCNVTFFDYNNKMTGKTKFYLAEGNGTNYTFKFHLINKFFHLVGEIYKKTWLIWFSSENLRSNEKEIEDEIEEDDVYQKMIHQGETLEEIWRNRFDDEIREEITVEPPDQPKKEISETIQEEPHKEIIQEMAEKKHEIRKIRPTAQPHEEIQEEVEGEIQQKSKEVTQEEILEEF